MSMQTLFGSAEVRAAGEAFTRPSSEGARRQSRGGSMRTSRLAVRGSAVTWTRVAPRRSPVHPQLELWRRHIGAHGPDRHAYLCGRGDLQGDPHRYEGAQGDLVSAPGRYDKGGVGPSTTMPRALLPRNRTYVGGPRRSPASIGRCTS